MGRKNYLLEELSSEEKSYLSKIILNVRNRYIRDNYEYINHNCLNISECNNIGEEYVFEDVLMKSEMEFKSAVEFEKLIADDKLYNIVKALSFKEKVVLFSLYKENKSINKIALEMKVDRITVWRIKNRVLNKIMKNLIGGKENV